MSEVIEFRQHLRRVQLAAQPEAAAVAGSAQPATATELELEAVREAAFKAGQEQAMRDLRAQIDAAQALQNKTLQRLQEMEVELKQEVEAALPDLIIEGVRRMIEGWQPGTAEVEQQVEQMLSSFEGDSGPLRVWLSSDAMQHMNTLQQDLERKFPGLSLIEDAELMAGECYASGRFGLMDGRYESKLKSLRKVFH